MARRKDSEDKCKYERAQNSFLEKLMKMVRKIFLKIKDAGKKARYFFYKIKYLGSNVECPLCGKRARAFLSFGLNLPVFKKLHVIGGGWRSNVKCPFCFSTDRERLIFLYLFNKRAISNTPLKLLHIAPEATLGKILQKLKNINYVSMDLCSNAAMVKMDATHLGFRESSFDVVICNHVLEHILDDHKAMLEIYRVLKSRGWAILQAPTSAVLEKTLEDPRVTAPEDREKLFGQADHVRMYGRDYTGRLTKAGFIVEPFDFAEEFGGAAIKRYGLNKEEKIYVCAKT